MRKSYEHKASNPGEIQGEVEGNVAVRYTNRTLKEQEEKRAKDKDL